MEQVWQPRTVLELIGDQLTGVESFHRSRHRDEADSTPALSRELRLDLARRLEARRREHLAVLAQAERQLQDSARPLASRVDARAVVAHRQPWLRDKVAEALRDYGISVVAVLDNGAEAAGTIIAEQPELVLLEDRLPTMSGLEVVERARAFAPKTLVAAQLSDESEVGRYLDAGAAAAFSRRIPPGTIADELVLCLREAGGPFATV